VGRAGLTAAARERGSPQACTRRLQHRNPLVPGLAWPGRSYMVVFLRKQPLDTRVALAPKVRIENFKKDQIVFHQASGAPTHLLAGWLQQRGWQRQRMSGTQMTRGQHLRRGRGDNSLQQLDASPVAACLAASAILCRAPCLRQPRKRPANGPDADAMATAAGPARSAFLHGDVRGGGAVPAAQGRHQVRGRLPGRSCWGLRQGGWPRPCPSGCGRGHA